MCSRRTGFAAVVGPIERRLALRRRERLSGFVDDMRFLVERRARFQREDGGKGGFAGKSRTFATCGRRRGRATDGILSKPPVPRPSIAMYASRTPLASERTSRVALWKLATESLFVAAGQPFWELVERGRSYAAPVAFAIVVVTTSHQRNAGRDAAGG
jgi:hypothetical protein